MDNYWSALVLINLKIRDDRSQLGLYSSNREERNLMVLLLLIDTLF